MFELHTWGPLENIPSFSPDSLAIIWYLTLTLPPSQFKIIPSSNPTIAPNGQLPALKHDGKIYGGLFAILKYLNKLGINLEENSGSQSSSHTILALTNYISTNISILSSYTLFVHRQNFESITRPLFTQLVPFPMQYNLPLYQRDLSKKQCTYQGLLNNKSTQSPVKYPSSISKLQEQIEEKNKQKQLLFDDAKDNLRTLSFAQKTYQTLIEFIKTTNPSSSFSPYLFSSSPTIADLLLLAHLQLQTSSIFPVPVLKTLIESQFPQLLQYLNQALNHLHPLESSLTISPPQGRDVYSLSNSVLHHIGL